MPKRLKESGPESKPEPIAVPAAISAYMAVIGSKGGKIGGKRRLETMTLKRRSEVARKAAQARWARKS
jgi:hypothetical protein